MSTDWVSSVDMLADAGIVNFDAAAYVTGTPARFVGSPQYPVYNLPPLKTPVKQDEYKPTDTSLVKTPAWKKVLFGILAAAGIVWGVRKISSAPALIKGAGEKVCDFFKNLFKRKP